ncbi:MAG: ATP-dependent helicase [Candidatus Harrisonbacteria bacterium CG10_big_fil_rev_8_21_14_0_10_49_15]|uniref:ATP-dependent helicase n=1 Tax=Candidatus Harrisonbacteria bacterium CG10_big_fil_rev_8_21_14_0_10_49_15 TaxID=1974587 RepID=A0A2H0UM22_9BACT|nr:MAG: ATP-dependent helicase [Candidatus Harrisonbacteria bacterium CG10_big_fil_rev_8_21_14_0_10_49_15]
MSTERTFSSLGVAPGILAVLDRLGFVTCTPIQEKSIPGGLEGKDLVGIAQTGTGKTLAFGIPMIQAALQGKHGLVVLPTRELAAQVQEQLDKVGGSLGIKTTMLIGGMPIGRQIQGLRRKPQIIIGTPGRIIDHLEQKTLSLADTKVLVLDEADRMLDMGFAPQLKRILKVLPVQRQTMLFSATMPENIISIARAHMQQPTRVEIAPQGTAAERVTQELFFVRKPDKPRLLEKIVGEYKGSILVFSRMKFGAKRIAAGLRAAGHSAAEIHSNRTLNQRQEALQGFKNGKYRILVATDIAARGIDVKGIELVINFDLPQAAEDYVHRIGRTGRAGGDGHAISFATPDQRRDVRNIELLIRATLPQSQVVALPPARAQLERGPRLDSARHARSDSRQSGQAREYPSRDNRSSGGRPSGRSAAPRSSGSSFSPARRKPGYRPNRGGDHRSR